MKTKYAWIVVAAAMSGLAFAGSDTMKNLDEDQSGTVSKEEAAGDEEVIAVFEEIDINGDGEIDAVEFSKFEAQMPAGESEEKE